MSKKKLSLYKLAKYTNLEIVMEAQIQSTGANQAKLMEKYKKNKKSVQHQVFALKIVYAILILFVIVVPIFTILQVLESFGTLPAKTIFFGGSLFFGVFFLTQFIYLLLLGMFNISAMMTGEAFKWYETLPISKRRLQKLGLITVIRNLDAAIIIIIISFPIIIAIITQNILLVIISVLISVLNVIFVVSLLVLIAEKMSRIFMGDQVSSKKATIVRIVTMLSYFIAAMSASIIFQWAINAINDIFISLAAMNIPDIVNFILTLIPFPFAPASLLTLLIDPTKFSSNMWISGLIGTGVLMVLAYFLYNKAVSSMKMVTISSAAEKKVKTEQKRVEVHDVDIIVRSPIQAYRKKDLSAATRDMQTLMYLILPIILPFVYSIILVFSIGSAVGSFNQEDVLIFWSILMFYQPMISIIVTTGFLNMEDGGASILAGLPINPRDQVKAKLSVLLTIQTLSFFIPALLFITSPVFIDYLLLFVAWYPISLVFLFTIFSLKIRLFGRMKYKYVLEEVNPNKKTLKWIIMVATEGLILVFYLITGGILLLFFGLIPMVIILSLTSLFILTGLVIGVNRMFPKEFGKRKMISIRQALRKKPLIGTLIVILVYFAFLYLPQFLEVLLLPIYSIVPLTIMLFIRFFYNFGFLMLLWLLVVPKSLRLPNGKETISKYLKSIKLMTPGMKKSKFLINILLALSCTGIYFFSLWIFPLLLGDFQPDPSVVFGSPRFTSQGFIYGWFFFVLMLIPGIWEEWAFRGVIIPLNSKKYSKLWVLIISSAAFGLLHFSNILAGQNWISTLFQVLYATELGFLFGYIFIKTKSLLPSIIIHYLINSLGQFFVYGAVFYNEISVVIYLIFAVGVVPAILGILLVYIITNYAFPRLYQE
ncbi:MAG: CPBP family intramembrane metalloprotease [Promethearchaeota archaeon]|nr:MAG: CPBP family intramembrane metalloprotease [Candidatus Lokiarchaeota archaeon]